jgi:TRAP-type C4-dicarboxylate transport system substrate-binding protein
MTPIHACRFVLQPHRRRLLRFGVIRLGIVLAAILFAGAARAATWELLTPYAAEDFETRNLEQFANEVTQASAGALRVVVLPEPGRFDSAAIRQLVASGRMPAGAFLLSQSGGDASFQVDAVPFLATDYDHALALWDAQRAAIEPKLQPEGLKIAFVVPRAPTELFVNRQVWKMDDVRGLRLLDDSPAAQRLAVLIGANPTPLPAGMSVSQAFAADRLDGMFVSIPAAMAEGMAGATPFVYDIRASLPKSIVVFNAAAYQSLDAETQRILLNAAVNAQNHGWQASGTAHNDGIDLLRAKGVTVAAVEQPVAEGLAHAGATMTDEWLQRSGSEGRAILYSYGAHRR